MNGYDLDEIADCKEDLKYVNEKLKDYLPDSERKFLINRSIEAIIKLLEREMKRYEQF